MPQIVFVPCTLAVQSLLELHYDVVAVSLQTATAKIFNEKPLWGAQNVEVQLAHAPVRSTSSTIRLTIIALASHRATFDGKQREWEIELARAWAETINRSNMEVLRKALPDTKVAIWPAIVQGATWGTVDQILKPS